MKRHSFPKLSLALFNRLGKKKYKIEPVPQKPYKGGFEQFLNKPTPLPTWRMKVSQVAMARRKAKRYA